MRTTIRYSAGSVVTMLYQQIVRVLRRAARMVPDDATEEDYETAVEFDLRRAGESFVRQPIVSGGRGDILLGDSLIELKCTYADHTIFDVTEQAHGYLTDPRVHSVIVAVLHVPSRQVHIRALEEREGALMVVSRVGVNPRQAVMTTAAVGARLPVPWAPPSPRQKAEPLSQEDYVNILPSLPSWKYQLLTKVLRNTGLRETEVLARTAEYFYQDGPLYFLRTHRAKRRGEPVWEDVALHPMVGAEVKAFIQGLHIRPGDRVFQFKARIYQRVFRAAAERALGRPAHPHMLRHLFTKTLIDGGVPVGVAQHLLGHASEQTTLKHYYDLTRTERAEIARRMPV